MTCYGCGSELCANTEASPGPAEDSARGVTEPVGLDPNFKLGLNSVVCSLSQRLSSFKFAAGLGTSGFAYSIFSQSDGHSILPCRVPRPRAQSQWAGTRRPPAGPGRRRLARAAPAAAAGAAAVQYETGTRHLMTMENRFGGADPKLNI